MPTGPENLGRRNRRLAGFALGFAAAVALGIAIASLAPRLPEAVRGTLGLASDMSVTTSGTGPASDEAAQRKRSAAANDETPAVVRLTGSQIEIAGIELVPVRDGTLVRRIIVPGTIVPNANRIARVSVKLSATVAELRK